MQSQYNKSRRLEGIRKRTRTEASTKRTDLQHHELESSGKKDGWRQRVVAPSPSDDSVGLQEGAGTISDDFLMGSAQNAFWITNVDFFSVSWMRANLGALTANHDLIICDEYHEASCSIRAVLAVVPLNVSVSLLCAAPRAEQPADCVVFRVGGPLAWPADR